MSVSAVVPAHNEAPTIGEVIRVLKNSSAIDEIIVVSDGSTDDTSEVARTAGADLVIELPVKGGKGGALAAGVAAAKGEILFFCDADLYGLTPAHVERLIAPVREGTLAMCIGLRDWPEPLAWFIPHLPYIGGERALKREVFEAIPPRLLHGFGIEVALNAVCRARKLKYAGIVSTGVTQRRKMEKVGALRGLWGYIIMIGQVVFAMISAEVHRNAFNK